jgi:F-type H+-transporting ATPase subunit epsilon
MNETTAMEKGVRLRILTPGGVFADELFDMVILRAKDGDMGILPGHEPCSVALGYGTLRVRKDGARADAYAVVGGFAQVRGDQVVVLTPVADTPERLAQAIANIARDRADNKLQEQVSDLEVSRAETALRRTLVHQEGSAFAILKGQLEQDQPEKSQTDKSQPDKDRRQEPENGK